MKITFLAALIIGLVVYKIVKLIVEADRDAKMARVKADLKVRLLDRVQDPELLRDILDKDLDLSPEGLQLHKEAWDKNKAVRAAEEEREDGGWRFVSGMVFFFIGVALLVMALVGVDKDAEDALGPGIFMIFFGWVMLGWHVYSQERKTDSPDDGRQIREGHTSP